MSKRGRKRVPSAVQEARGNPSHRPLNEDEPQYEAAKLTPPAGLKGEALKEWNRLAPELVAKGVLRTPAVTLFAEYCEIVGDVARVKARIATVGYEDARKLKYVQEVMQLRGQLKQYAAELGITPTTSASVRAKTAKRDAPDTPGAKTNRRRRFFGVIDGGQQKHA